MSLQQPRSTSRRPRQEWLVHGLIPLGELVLLDGDHKVGKTLLTSVLGSLLTNLPTMQSPGTIIYANIDEQNDILDEQLDWQQPRGDAIRRINLDDLPTTTDMFADLIPILEKEITSSQTRILFLDGLLPFMESRFNLSQKNPTAAQYFAFWKQLRLVAELNKCTIFVTRNDGLHQCRSYGPFTRTGSELARIILTLQWHPVNPSVRLINLAQNQRGTSHVQWHLVITPTGRAFFDETEPHQVLKPAKSPATWKPDPHLADPHGQLIEQVERLIADVPIKHSQLEELMKEHCSPQKLQQVMARMKLPTHIRGYERLYVPTEAMTRRYQENEKRQLNEMPRDDEKTPENQPHPARAEEKPAQPSFLDKALNLLKKPASATVKSQAS